MIHGRFQPFHNGHLEYLLAAAARCDRLLVGLASPSAADPFTEAQCVRMLDAVLGDLELRPRSCVIRFSVDDAVPDGAVHYLRVFDAEDRLRAERLACAGCDVVVLHEGRPKTVSGARVRASLREDGDWERLVPRAVARVLLALPYGVKPQSSR